MFENDLEEAFFAYTGYFRGSFRTTEIWLPKMFKAYTDKSRNEAIGQRCTCKNGNLETGHTQQFVWRGFRDTGKEWSIGQKFSNKDSLQSYMKD